MALRTLQQRSTIIKLAAATPTTLTHHNLVTSSTANHSLHELPASRIPTYHFQKGLPRLPIPHLEHTCQRYLAAVEPLLTSAEQLSATQRIVADFQQNDGRLLHDQLVEQDARQRQTSYISALWTDEQYLRSRSPLPIDYNPFIVIDDDPDPEKMSQLRRATDCVVSALRFRNSLERRRLEPDMFHLKPKRTDNDWFRRLIAMLPSRLAWYGAYAQNVYPLDMSQYRRLFSTTRVPRREQDELQTYDDARHIVVLRRDHLFRVDVIDDDGDIAAPQDIHAALRRCYEKSEAPADLPPIWVLTSADRDSWADARDALLQAGGNNSEVLHSIDSALFTLSLDDIELGSLDASDRGLELYRAGTHQFLHGGGSSRWFDKSVQLIVTRCGRAGWSFEHAWGDGVCVMRLLQEMHRDTRRNDFCSSSLMPSQGRQLALRELRCTVNDELRAMIQRAGAEHQRRIASFRVDPMRSERIGRQHLREHGISADGLFQLAFQVAYSESHDGRVASTYESASTAAFLHGRTETLRPCSRYTKVASEMLRRSGATASDEEVLRVVKQSSAHHTRLLKEAATGQGFDRHLFALRHMAERKGLQCAMFDDTAYKRMQHNELSTSTLSEPAILIGGFGPTARDCIGLSYRFFGDWVGCIATSWRGEQEPDAFLHALEGCFERLAQVLAKKADVPNK